jgi:hypothetical protein
LLGAAKVQFELNNVSSSSSSNSSNSSSEAKTPQRTPSPSTTSDSGGDSYCYVDDVSSADDDEQAEEALTTPFAHAAPPTPNGHFCNNFTAEHENDQTAWRTSPPPPRPKALSPPAAATTWTDDDEGAATAQHRLSFAIWHEKRKYCNNPSRNKKLQEGAEARATTQSLHAMIRICEVLPRDNDDGGDAMPLGSVPMALACAMRAFCSSAAVQQAACQLVRVLMRCTANASRLAADTLELILTAMRGHPSALALQESACAALANLAFDDAMCDAMTNKAHKDNADVDAALLVLRAMQRFCAVPGVAAVCCAALGGIAASEHGRLRLLRLNAENHVLDVMQAHPEHASVQGHALNTLGALFSSGMDPRLVRDLAPPAKDGAAAAAPGVWIAATMTLAIGRCVDAAAAALLRFAVSDPVVPLASSSALARLTAGRFFASLDLEQQQQQCNVPRLLLGCNRVLQRSGVDRRVLHNVCRVLRHIGECKTTRLLRESTTSIALLRQAYLRNKKQQQQQQQIHVSERRMLHATLRTFKSWSTESACVACGVSRPHTNPDGNSTACTVCTRALPPVSLTPVQALCLDSALLRRTYLKQLDVCAPSLLPELCGIIVEYLDFTFATGELVDVLDTVGKFLPARIQSIQHGTLRVHFCGWSSRFDECIDFASSDVDVTYVAPFGSRTTAAAAAIKK